MEGVMGDCYTRGGDLVCEGCGGAGQTRKRTCPHTVTYADGMVLPVCNPAALCPECFEQYRGLLHAHCAERAQAANAREQARRAALVAGAYEVRSAFGSWHPDVPAGSVGVIFRALSGAELLMLVPQAEYRPEVRRYLNDYPGAVPWEGPHAGAYAER